MPSHSDAASTIAVYASRPKLLRQCLSRLLPAGIGWLLLGAVINRILPYHPLYVICLTVLLTVTGTGFLCSLSRLVFRCPLFILTREGIQDGSYGTVFPLIRWQAIEKIVVKSSSVDVFMRETVANTPGTRLFLAIAHLMAGRGFASLTVSERVIPGATDELFNRIRAYCADQHIGEYIRFVQQEADI